MRTIHRALRAIATVVAVLAVAGTATAIIALATRGQNAGDALFEQAELAYNNGQYADAFRFYQKLVAEHPKSRHYERALFLAAFLSEQFLHEPERAVRLYKRLVAERPRASFADEALRNAGDILREQGKFDQAIALYRQMYEQYGDDPNIGARALMKIAQAQHEAGDAEAAAQTCQEIRKRYPQLPERVAQATWELAKIRESQGDLRGALRYYRELVRRFPTSRRAHQAKKEIAWLADRLEEASPTARRAGRKLVPLAKAYRGQPLREAGLFACLRVLLGDQGIWVSEDKLRGISGEAFRFFYSPDDRLGSANVYLEDPLTTVAQCFGFDSCSLQFAGDFDAAWKAVRKFLDNNVAVLTTLELPPPTWAIIVGYDDQAEEVWLFSSAAEYRPLSLERFKKTWGTPYCPTIRLRAAPRPGRYLIFAMGKTSKKPNMEKIVRQAILRAHRLTRGAKIGAYFSGKNAFAQLAADIQRITQGAASEDELRSMDAFFRRPMEQLIDSRRAAGEFLAMWLNMFQGEARRALEDAAPLFSDSAEALEELRQAYLAFRGPSPPPEGMRSPAEIAQEVAQIESEAAAKLATAAAALSS